MFKDRKRQIQQYYITVIIWILRSLKKNYDVTLH